MQVTKTNLEGVLILEPKVFGDARGWFMETWSARKFQAAGLTFEFVQDNQSYSAQRGTFRGLHYQTAPFAQSKLVRCTRGKLLDIAVDIREGSETFAKWIAVELTAENKKQLLIPRGFAHGFLTLTDDVEIQYKADNFYAPTCDGNIIWNDSEIALDLPFAPTILADKDAKAPTLRERLERNELRF